MSKVTSLIQFKSDKRFDSIVENITELRKFALIEFDGLVKAGKLIGGWDDQVWKYQNRSLWFSQLRSENGTVINSKTTDDQRIALTGIWAELIRIYVMSRIKKGTSGKAISGNIIAVSWLFESFNYNPVELLKLKQVSLSNVHDLLIDEGTTASTAFEKYKIVISFVKDTLVANKLCPNFKPKVDVLNPRLKEQDPTSKEFAAHRDKKYNDQIDVYVAKAKRRFDEDRLRIENGESPKYLVTKPLYDELRFLAIPFFMAFGLRVGELCRLTDDCLQYDDVNERWYLNVYTQKGQLPYARPVPRVWEKVIRDAFDEIIQLTADDRKYARLVESKGQQAFVDVLAFPDRTDEVRSSLIEHGYDPELYFYRSEIGKAGDCHLSGLPYNGLRERHPYHDAAVGSVMAKVLGRNRTTQIVISKQMVAEIAYQRYLDYQKTVFQENIDDAEVATTYASNTFSADVPFSKHLFIAREETFALRGNKTHGFVPKPMTSRSILRWMSSDSSSSKSLFERFDIRDDDGKIVEIGSHQFRHWLTTALIRSGKSEMMIDLFMGRTAGQTRHYDHRTSKERAEGLREKYISDNVPEDALGRRVNRMRANNVSIDVIESAVAQTLQVANFTPWGLCWRDLDVNPCEKGMMCMRGDDGKGCSHFGIDPEDMEAKQSIHNTKIHYENQLSILLPNYESLRHELNSEEPLDQHIQFCLETLDGCENALRAYENYEQNKSNRIGIVQVFSVEDSNV